jgi:hypothetical protein
MRTVSHDFQLATPESVAELYEALMGEIAALAINSEGHVDVRDAMTSKLDTLRTPFPNTAGQRAIDALRDHAVGLFDFEKRVAKIKWEKLQEPIQGPIQERSSEIVGSRRRHLCTAP